MASTGRRATPPPTPADPPPRLHCPLLGGLVVKRRTRAWSPGGCSSPTCVRAGARSCSHTVPSPSTTSSSAPSSACASRWTLERNHRRACQAYELHQQEEKRETLQKQ